MRVTWRHDLDLPCTYRRNEHQQSQERNEMHLSMPEQRSVIFHLSPTLDRSPRNHQSPDVEIPRRSNIQRSMCKRATGSASATSSAKGHGHLRPGSAISNPCPQYLRFRPCQGSTATMALWSQLRVKKGCRTYENLRLSFGLLELWDRKLTEETVRYSRGDGRGPSIMARADRGLNGTPGRSQEAT